MCLLLVGITLRMAPLIDDMGKSRNSNDKIIQRDCEENDVFNAKMWAITRKREKREKISGKMREKLLENCSGRFPQLCNWCLVELFFILKSGTQLGSMREVLIHYS